MEALLMIKFAQALENRERAGARFTSYNISWGSERR